MTSNENAPETGKAKRRAIARERFFWSNMAAFADHVLQKGEVVYDPEHGEVRRRRNDELAARTVILDREESGPTHWLKTIAKLAPNAVSEAAFTSRDGLLTPAPANIDASWVRDVLREAFEAEFKADKGSISVRLAIEGVDLENPRMGRRSL